MIEVGVGMRGLRKKLVGAQGVLGCMGLYKEEKTGKKQCYPETPPRWNWSADWPVDWVEGRLRIPWWWSSPRWGLLFLRFGLSVFGKARSQAKDHGTPNPSYPLPLESIARAVTVR